MHRPQIAQKTTSEEFYKKMRLFYEDPMSPHQDLPAADYCLFLMMATGQMMAFGSSEYVDHTKIRMRGEMH